MYKRIIASTAFRPSNGVRSACAIVALVATFAVNIPPRAQSDYPNRPIHLIVPYGPGGVADVNMRIVAGKLSDRLKQPVVVENRPGAGSIVAAKAVATAAPDGIYGADDGQQQRCRRGAFRRIALQYSDRLRLDFDHRLL